MPTHRLKMMDKATGQKGQVGAGWLNGDGSVTIKLNACVVLNATALEGCLLTLFPADRTDWTPNEEDE